MVAKIVKDEEMPSSECAKPSSMHFMLAAYRVIQKDFDENNLDPTKSFRRNGSTDRRKLAQIQLKQALPVGDETVVPATKAKTLPRGPSFSGISDVIDVDDYISEEEEKEEENRDQYWIDVEIPGNDPGNNLESLMPHLLSQVIKPCLISLGHDSDLVFLKQHTSEFRQWQTPQALPLPNAAFVVMRILQQDESENEDGHVVRHAAALCLPNRLVTVTSSATSALSSHGAAKENPPKATKNSCIEDTLQDVLLQRSQQLLEESVSGCVLLWLNFHCNRTSNATHKLRETIYELFEVMTHDVEHLDAKDVAACKDRLLRISAVAEEQNECIQALVEGGDAVSDAVTFDENPTLQGALNVIKQGAASTERHVLRLEKRIADLEQGLDSFQQKKINGRLNALTVLSAIFLPLTLMTGMYGMNFVNIPELNKEYGYFVLLAAMAFVASALMIFFWRAGWCKN